MAAFGTFTLLIALVVATYAGVASLIGARRGNRRLIASGRAGVYALAAVLGLSSVALVYAFVSHDYSIKYVHHYSDAASPLFYQITAYWGGLDGSILWWVFLLSVFSAIAIYTNRNRHRELLPYTVTVLMVIADFFLFVIIFFKNPFDSYLMDIPTVGKGLNPLLQNAYMVTHPPSPLHGLRRHEHPVRVRDGGADLGPARRHLDRVGAQVDAGRLVLPVDGPDAGDVVGVRGAGLGRLLGLGPGRERRLPALADRDRVPAFDHDPGTPRDDEDMERLADHPDVLPDHLRHVHDPVGHRAVGARVRSGHPARLVFTVFMVLMLIVSFGFVIDRMPELSSRGKLDSWLSREARLPGQQLDPAVRARSSCCSRPCSRRCRMRSCHERITVSAPFFNLWMVPIGLTLLFLTGVGPLIAWRKATPSNLRYQFTTR